MFYSYITYTARIQPHLGIQFVNTQQQQQWHTYINNTYETQTHEFTNIHNKFTYAEIHLVKVGQSILMDEQTDLTVGSRPSSQAHNPPCTKKKKTTETFNILILVIKRDMASVSFTISLYRLVRLRHCARRALRRVWAPLFPNRLRRPLHDAVIQVWAFGPSQSRGYFLGNCTRSQPAKQ